MFPFWVWLTIGFILFDVILYVFLVLNEQPLLRPDDEPLPILTKPGGTKVTIVRILFAPLFIVIGLPLIIFYILPGIGLSIIYFKAKAALARRR